MSEQKSSRQGKKTTSMERRAQALRENLAKRKAQARGRITLPVKAKS